MSVTISSEVLPTLTLTWQPVCFSKSETQSTFGSVEPSSTYPAQAIRFTLPSPAPSLVGAFGPFGAFTPPPLDEELSSPPQATTPSDSTAAIANAAIP